MFQKSSKFIRSFVVLIFAMVFLVSGCGQTQKPASTSEKSTTGQSSVQKEETKKLNFPERPITLVIPASAGGATDLLARAVEKVWSKYCPQPVQMSIKATAGGVDGANTVAKSKPDGYTLLISFGAGQDMVAPQLQEVPYNSLKDFAPVSMLSITSSMIAVPQNSQFKTLKDVVAFGKKDNKPITAAVSQAGGTNDIVTRAFGKIAGINITAVPHQGSSQAITSLVGEQTMIGGGAPAELMPQVKAGRIRLLGVSFPERDPIVPDIPTFKEQGVDFSSWGALRAIAAPAGTPKDVINYLDGVFKKISEDPEFKKAMADLMLPIIYKGPEETAKVYKETYEGYGKIINELDMKKVVK
jgi:tripartite-type tricarboxylate transporter receptor subunit TctC